MRTSLVAVLGLFAVACTGQPQEAPVRSVASPKPSPAPYRASPSAATQPAPYQAPPSGTGGGAPTAYAPHAGGAIKWHSRIADAQAEARAQGKLILVGSTKPDCGLCDKFAHTTAPQCWSRLSQVAVPYMYDILHPEAPRVDQTLRANLKGCALMPLVGFLTPDLNWVHGFWGPRSVTEFMGDIESARRIYPVHAAALPAPAPIENAPTAMLNEYGEREWSAPADWPAPEDALGPVADVGTPATEPEPIAPAAEPVAAAPVEPAPAAERQAGWSAPASSAPVGPAIAAAPAIYTPPPSAPVASAPPVAPAPAAAPGMSDADAQAALREVYALIQGAKFDEARTALKRVSQALPNTHLGREADKGAVAIYNARRIATADAGQRGTLAERARKDLDGSMWVGLFS